MLHVRKFAAPGTWVFSSLVFSLFFKTRCFFSPYVKNFTTQDLNFWHLHQSPAFKMHLPWQSYQSTLSLKKKTKCKIFKIFLPNFKTDIGYCKTYLFSIKNQLTHNYKKANNFFFYIYKMLLVISNPSSIYSEFSSNLLTLHREKSIDLTMV